MKNVSKVGSMKEQVEMLVCELINRRLVVPVGKEEMTIAVEWYIK